MITKNEIHEAISLCLVEAGTTYREDQFAAYESAITAEKQTNSRWVLEQILENGKIAKEEQLPLCDDTGIPHVIIEVGEEVETPKGWLAAIKTGIADGLRRLPGRPMAVLGNDIERVEQSRGLDDDPGGVEPAPFLISSVPGNHIKITVLMLGGGPEIRARTLRVFHRRDIRNVLSEAASWLKEEIRSLGCTPTTIAMGIGRSHMEASALMLKAMATGTLDQQSELERFVTGEINDTRVGPLGLGGKITALGCFLKIGPTRASGVRIVCVRPCCLVEPRRSTVTLG